MPDPFAVLDPYAGGPELEPFGGIGPDIPGSINPGQQEKAKQLMKIFMQILGSGGATSAQNTPGAGAQGLPPPAPPPLGPVPLRDPDMLGTVPPRQGLRPMLGVDPPQPVGPGPIAPPLPPTPGPFGGPASTGATPAPGDPGTEAFLGGLQGRNVPGPSVPDALSRIPESLEKYIESKRQGTGFQVDPNVGRRSSDPETREAFERSKKKGENLIPYLQSIMRGIKGPEDIPDFVGTPSEIQPQPSRTPVPARPRRAPLPRPARPKPTGRPSGGIQVTPPPTPLSPAMGAGPGGDINFASLPGQQPLTGRQAFGDALARPGPEQPKPGFFSGMENKELFEFFARMGAASKPGTGIGEVAGQAGLGTLQGARGRQAAGAKARLASGEKALDRQSTEKIERAKNITNRIKATLTAKNTAELTKLQNQWKRMEHAYKSTAAKSQYLKALADVTSKMGDALSQAILIPDDKDKSSKTRDSTMAQIIETYKIATAQIQSQLGGKAPTRRRPADPMGLQLPESAKRK